VKPDGGVHDPASKDLLFLLGDGVDRDRLNEPDQRLVGQDTLSHVETRLDITDELFRLGEFAGVGGEDLEPVFDVVELSVCVSAQAGLIEICDCWQKRNEASYISRRKTNAARQYANRMDTS
jgi:hypothetical protein